MIGRSCRPLRERRSRPGRYDPTRPGLTASRLALGRCGWPSTARGRLPAGRRAGRGTGMRGMAPPGRSGRHYHGDRPLRRSSATSCGGEPPGAVLVGSRGVLRLAATALNAYDGEISPLPGVYARRGGGHRYRPHDQPLEDLRPASTTVAAGPTSRCRWGTTHRGGKAGELVAELFKDPDKQVQRAVENFRLVVERGGLGAV